MTINGGAAVALPRAGPAPGTAAPPQDETSGSDLVLPLVAVGAAGLLAGYGYVRRTRRARTRTTPGGGPAPPSGLPPAAGLDEWVRRSLVLADDCVRTSREELGFAEARFDAVAVAPFARAVRRAEAELAAAFGMRRRYDHGLPEDPAARRQALAAMAGRCEEAGRLLDEVAGGFDGLRGLDRGTGGALEVAEARFRELAARTAGTEAVLARLARRYAPSAWEYATGYVEQAKDRLLFATAHLNRSRQSADLARTSDAARHLRAAEGAVAQAAVLLGGVERLAAELDEAAAMVAAALTGAEAERAGAAARLTGVPPGEARARILRTDSVLASVREELTAPRPYDPLDVLRRVVRAVSPLAVGGGGVLSAAALLTARSATAAAADFVTTHRGAVGVTARALLTEAERVLACGAPADRSHADALAREARGLAEQDVRAHGNPYAEADAHDGGTAGAVLGGILLPPPSPAGTPPSFGGPGTRARRTAGTA
ncbi:hypothetical protein ACF061_06540 [Streptomyces sp. NPDC015220]|uniref:hypothetical protein n=1 Tax=Streptomyces sp. NPDC015220 TaxID=3364947 RepID=UPI0036FF6DF2